MATLRAKIFKHHKKSDGSFNVKICLYHREERVFIDTEHYVTEKQLTKNLKIKDVFVNSFLNKTIDDYRISVSELGKRLQLFTANQLKEYLLKKDEVIDFLKFCQIHIDALEEEKRDKSAANYKTVRNNIIDFVKMTSLPIENITPHFIDKYEKYLRRPREMKRFDQFGREYTQSGKALNDASVHNYLRDFRGFFSAAIKYYNKPSLGVVPIKYNPFEEYKIVESPEIKKRNIEIKDILKVAHCKITPGGRAELAQNLFMLSFMLCGMNAVDLYKFNYVIKNGRIEYNRSKTQGKRKDKAFISIDVPKEAESLLSFAAQLPERYSSIGNLNTALSKGTAQIAKLTGIANLQFYSARHTFGNLARNTCRLSKDDVALALNHVDNGRKTTDIYIEKDWKIVDEVQSTVLKLIGF